MPLLLRALALVVLLEAVAMLAVVVLLVMELLTSPVASFASGIAIIVIAVLAAIWLLAMFAGILGARGWIRGAVFTWQLIQLALAVGCFQGVFSQPTIGLLLLIPSVVAIALLFTPPVMNATRRVEPS